MSQSIVELKHVNIYQSNSLILSDVNISVDKGEFVYLVGKTGTGKSSLLKTMYGDLQLTEGEGWVVGHDLRKLTWKTVPFLRRNLGVVFQDFQLLTDRNVNENMKFVLKATGWKDEKLMDEKIADVLEKVGLKTKGQTFEALVFNAGQSEDSTFERLKSIETKVDTVVEWINEPV